MAKLVSYRNILDPLDVETKIITVSRAYELIDQLNYDPILYEVAITKNQVLIEEDFEIEDNDIIAVSLIPRGGGGGGGGKNVLGTIAMIAVAVVAPYAAAAINTSLGLGFAAGSIGMSMLTAGVMMAGSMLVNAILPPQTPDLNLSSGFEAIRTSPTYSWSQSANVFEQGKPVPILYGTHRVTPPLISKFIETVGDTQYLNLLYAVNDGVANINETTIKINDVDSSLFDGIQIWTRDGSNTQEIIPSFDDTRTDVSVGVPLSFDDYVNRETQGTQVQGLVVTLVAPRGLWYAKDDGNLGENSVVVQVEYKKTSDSIWNSMPNYITANTTDGIEYGTPEESEYSGTTTLVGSTNSPLRFTFGVDNLEADTYEIRAKIVEEPLTGTRYGSDISLEYYQEIVRDDFTFPNTSLLGIRALATDQLNGNIPRISVLATANSDNPSVIAQDILSRYGVSLSSIEQLKFDEWESFCNENNYKCNIYFDQTYTLRKALDIVGMLGRANIVQFGSKWNVIVDKPNILPTQGFLFNMANMVKDSFREEFLPLKDRTNLIDITYWDKDLDYEPQIVEVSNANYNEVDNVNKTSISYVGCTDRDMAIKYAKYLLNSSRYLTITQSFEVDTEAIVCRVGDVIRVSHDVPQIGQSGRILSGTTTSVTLDSEVILDEDDYYIQIRYNDTDEVIETQVAQSDITTDTLTFSELSKAPSKYDVFSIGKLNKVSKLMRVVNITKTSDMRSKISALEYIDEVYNDFIEVKADTSSDFGIKGLELNELFRYKNTSVISDIEARWRGAAMYYDVYVNGTFSKRVYESYCKIENLEAPKEHSISVIDSFGDKVSKSIALLGRLAPPEPPTNLIAIQHDEIIRISWDKSISLDTTKYEIRIGNTWNTARQIGIVGNVNTFEWYPDMDGTYRFLVKSIDASSVESTIPASYQMNVTNINQHLNVLVDYDGVDTDTPKCGTPQGMLFVSGVGYVPNNSLTFGDLESSTFGDYTTATFGGDVSFEGCVVDTNKVGITKIRMFNDFTSVSSTETFGSYPNRTFGTYLYDTFGGVTTSVGMNMYYSTSDDNITYSDWVKYTGIVDETFRYIKFKYDFDGDLDGTTTAISDFRAILDVPDVEYDIRDITVINSQSVLFADYGLDFYEAPYVGAISKSGAYLPDISNITSDGFTITAYDTNATQSTATFDINIQGY
jgi:predicted phage tail protein